MRIVGEKNTTHALLVGMGGLTLEDCDGITLVSPLCKGGYCNLYLLNCSNVTIRNGIFSKPNGQPDADGNGPHNVLFDGCTDCQIIGAKIERWARSEMGIGFYKSDGCVADSCEIVGPSRRQSADAITFDWGSNNCTASNNKINLWADKRKVKRMGHSAIVVASGSGHRIIMGTGYIQGSVEEFPIAVTSYYDADGNSVEDDDVNALPVSAYLDGFDMKTVYVGLHGTLLKG